MMVQSRYEGVLDEGDVAYADFMHESMQGGDIDRYVVDRNTLPRWHSNWLVSNVQLLWYVFEQVHPDGPNSLNADIMDEDDGWFFDAACMERHIRERVEAGDTDFTIGWWGEHSAIENGGLFEAGVGCRCGCGEWLVEPTVKVAVCEDCGDWLGAVVKRGYDDEENTYLAGLVQAHLDIPTEWECKTTFDPDRDVRYEELSTCTAQKVDVAWFAGA